MTPFTYHFWNGTIIEVEHRLVADRGPRSRWGGRCRCGFKNGDGRDTWGALEMSVFPLHQGQSPSCDAVPESREMLPMGNMGNEDMLSAPYNCVWIYNRHKTKTSRNSYRELVGWRLQWLNKLRWWTVFRHFYSNYFAVRIQENKKTHPQVFLIFLV